MVQSLQALGGWSPVAVRWVAPILPFTLIRTSTTVALIRTMGIGDPFASNYDRMDERDADACLLELKVPHLPFQLFSC